MSSSDPFGCARHLFLMLWSPSQAFIGCLLLELAWCVGQTGKFPTTMMSKRMVKPTPSFCLSTQCIPGRLAGPSNCPGGTFLDLSCGSDRVLFYSSICSLWDHCTHSEKIKFQPRQTQTPDLQVTWEQWLLQEWEAGRVCHTGCPGLYQLEAGQRK
jgi:hypothetical protein